MARRRGRGTLYFLSIWNKNDLERVEKAWEKSVWSQQGVSLGSLEVLLKATDTAAVSDLISASVIRRPGNPPKLLSWMELLRTVVRGRRMADAINFLSVLESVMVRSLEG